MWTTCEQGCCEYGMCTSNTYAFPDTHRTGNRHQPFWLCQLVRATAWHRERGCVVEAAWPAIIDEKKLKEAVMTGQYVKDQPANMMKAFADKLVGTHLGRKTLSNDGGCPLSGESAEEPQPQEVSEGVGCGTGGCGCSAPEK